MNRPQMEGKWRGFVVAFAVFTMSAAVTPVSAMKTEFGPTTESALIEQAIGGNCVPSAAKDALRSYQLKIANARTVEEARDLILSQTRLARKALSTASWLLPHSSSVRKAREKIGTLENRVYAANSQTDVARDFSEFLALPVEPEEAKLADQDGTDSSPIVLAETDLNESAVQVSSGGHGCNYTTGEVIIICLGFLLFIIPGIIFLIIFC